MQDQTIAELRAKIRADVAAVAAVGEMISRGIDELPSRLFLQPEDEPQLSPEQNKIIDLCAESLAVIDDSLDGIAWAAELAAGKGAAEIDDDQLKNALENLDHEHRHIIYMCLALGLRLKQAVDERRDTSCFADEVEQLSRRISRWKNRQPCDVAAPLPISVEKKVEGENFDFIGALYAK